MARNLILLTVATLAFMLGLGYFTADPGRLEAPSAADVRALFDQLAFSAQGEAGIDGRGPSLRRWTRPVKVAVIGAPRDEAAARRWGGDVERLVSVWDTVRGLDAEVVFEGPRSETAMRSGANLTVLTVPDAEIERVARARGVPPKDVWTLLGGRGGCLTLGAETPALSRVTILMRGGLDDDRRTVCLGEKLALAFGFSIPTKMAADVFRLRPDGLRFYGRGRLAVETAYAEGMTPGLSRAEALAVADAWYRREGLALDD